MLTGLFLGCNSDDDTSNIPDTSNTSDTPQKIDLKEAQLKDFLFTEIDYLNIGITQPIIEDNEEIKEGEIIVTLPHTATSLMLTLGSVDINTEAYSISPSVGTPNLFSETEFVKYTITSKTNPEKSLHYNIKIVIAKNPADENLDISNFELSTKDNSKHTNTFLIKESSVQLADYFLYCLFSESVDFSSLIPTITYEGSIIEYKINDGDYTEYQLNSEKSIDFKYPNNVYFKVSNSTKSTSKTFRIVVDTQYPILFDEPEITLPNVKTGSISNHPNVTTWTNKGNNPITSMSPDEYTDIVGLDNIFLTTLSDNGTVNVKPGESGVVNIVTKSTPIAGEYEATAIFGLNFDQNTLRIVSTPTDGYINNIGYKNATLKTKVSVTN
jgi:hypothetical protein